MVAVACAHADPHAIAIATAARPKTFPCRRAVIEDLRPARALVDGLSGCLAPREAVLRPLQRDHPDAVIGGIASRGAGDDHLIAGLQRSARHTSAAELTGAAPLHVVD